MELTKKERVIIANQLKMLEKLYPDEAKYYADHRKAIEYGFKLHYSWIAEHIDDDEMSEAECKEVLNVLDMHRAITYSYNRIKDKTDLTVEEIRFRGYDGNNETRQFSYTNYFITDLGRFDELKFDSEYPDFNSHCPMVGKYQRMLAIWENSPDKFDLNEEQIKELLEA
ncbi:MAG: YfbU family protein [Neptuniibacter sp.]